MKAKLMALILAAGLGITGIAMTTQAAQAAGANTTDTCKHETLYLNETFLNARYHDGTTHWSTYLLTYRCSFCHDTIFTKTEERLEWHDYEQMYFQDGSVRSTCTGCKDSYDW